MKMWSGMASGRLQLFTFNLAIISFLDGAPSPSCRGGQGGGSHFMGNKNKCVTNKCTRFMSVVLDGVLAPSVPQLVVSLYLRLRALEGRRVSSKSPSKGCKTGELLEKWKRNSAFPDALSP